jgi:hypothetical protein
MNLLVEKKAAGFLGQKKKKKKIQWTLLVKHGDKCFQYVQKYGNSENIYFKVPEDI